MNEKRKKVWLSDGKKGSRRNEKSAKSVNFVLSASVSNFFVCLPARFSSEFSDSPDGERIRNDPLYTSRGKKKNEVEEKKSTIFRLPPRKYIRSGKGENLVFLLL